MRKLHLPIYIILFLALGCGESTFEPLSKDEPTLVLEVGDPVLVEAEPEETTPVSTVSVDAIMADAQQRTQEEQEIWTLPETRRELRRRSIEDLLKVCISEEGWANPIGCKAIWQTAHQVRACVTEEGTAIPCNQEGAQHRGPTVTGLWRISRYVTGVLPPRTFRHRWTSTITADCEQPSGWPERTRDGEGDYALWANYQPLCEKLMEVIPSIVDGDDDLQACPPRSRPLAWGCDPERRRAIREVLGQDRPLRGCNDTPIAQRRQLERLNCGETENAYWCRPGSPHCNTLPPSEQRLRRRLEEGQG